MSAPRHGTAPGQRAFWIALAVILAYLAGTVAISWPTNVLTAQSTSARTIQRNLALPLPQAWAFFTRSPQDPALIAYKQTGTDTWTRVDTLPQSSGENALGLSRNQRAQPTELALLASKAQFTSCNDFLSVCLGHATQGMTPIVNPSNGQIFCGRLRLVSEAPVKWKYRNEVPDRIRVVEYADINVACKG